MAEEIRREEEFIEVEERERVWDEEDLEDHGISVLLSAERVWGEDDLGGIEFLRWPKVGQEVTTIVSSVIETKDTVVKPREGEPFSIALSGVDYALYIEDSSKELSDRVTRLTIPTWEVVGKLKSILRKRKKEGKSLWGWTVTIKHIREGKQGVKQENYEVIEQD